MDSLLAHQNACLILNGLPAGHLNVCPTLDAVLAVHLYSGGWSSLSLLYFCFSQVSTCLSIFASLILVCVFVPSILPPKLCGVFLWGCQVPSLGGVGVGVCLLCPPPTLHCIFSSLCYAPVTPLLNPSHPRCLSLRLISPVCLSFHSSSCRPLLFLGFMMLCSLHLSFPKVRFFAAPSALCFYL